MSDLESILADYRYGKRDKAEILDELVEYIHIHVLYTASQDYKKQKTEISALKDEIEDLEDELCTLERELREVEAQKDDLVDEVEDLKQRLSLTPK